jgi:DDE superfamily endonuclease
VLVLDDTGDRKAGTKTAHVARQYLGSVGKTDNGIVAVTSLWADERVYWPIDVVPYTPASRLARGKSDPGFRTKPQLAVELVDAARRAGIGFRAVVADCLYGDNPGFTEALGRAGVAFVLAVKPRKGVWAPAEEAHTPRQAAAELAWRSPEEPAGAGGLDPGHPPVPQRSHRDLVGGRGEPARGRLGPESAPAAGRGDHRPGHAAEADQLLPGHQPAPPRRAAGIGGSGLGAGRPGRGGAPVQPAQLGRAKLQAGQARARLGRLPGQKRPRDPPPLAAGVLRVLVLLAGLVCRAPGPTGPCRAAGRPSGGRAGGNHHWSAAARACLARWWPGR